ncbi:MAG: DUF4157 domain-containing protein [Bacteroidetes bacterium]|nr:DUF4157 domain-containing protein [Bacteroidota bacterium]
MEKHSTIHKSASSYLPVQQQVSSHAAALSDNRPASVAQRKKSESAPPSAEQPVQRKPNNTGLPDQLKTGIENLSGHSMDDVQVHFNSSQPAQLNAHAYAQGNQIHLAPGQEKHLPHEAWHVVQQKQGRVKPTMQMKGKVNVNDDHALEKEADVMGKQALQRKVTDSDTPNVPIQTNSNQTQNPVQRKVGFEYEIGSIDVEKRTGFFGGNWIAYNKGDVILRKKGYSITADIDPVGGTHVEFILDPINEHSPQDLQKMLIATQNIVLDIQALTAPPVNNWKQANTIARINGYNWTRFLSVTGYPATIGQLQMTGGVRIDKLYQVTSGSALGREAPNWFHGAGPLQPQHYKEYARNYEATDPFGNVSQPIYQHAIQSVRNHYHFLTGPEKKAVASVISILVQLPLHGHNALPGAVGLLQARTDYSKIIFTLEEYLNQNRILSLGYNRFRAAVIQTLNPYIPGVNAGTPVFSPAFVIQGQQFHQVSIGQWLRNMMPSDGYIFRRSQGKDLITSKHFPGTPQQKKELRAFGGFGSKTDPGDRPVFEWRGIRQFHPNELLLVVAGMVKYLRKINK